MNKSAVAGILSPDGGLRTVVTQRWRMRAHVKKGERLFVVPGLVVEEPVPQGEIPAIIRAVHKYVIGQTAPKNPCGECRACCTTLYIASPEFTKPSHTTCGSCDQELGCFRHTNKPKVCRAFECDWLKSQRTNRIMGSELRPDHSGVIVTGPELGDSDDLFYVHPTEREISAPMRAWIDAEQAEGRKARLVTHYHGEAPPAEPIPDIILSEPFATLGDKL